VFAATTFKGKRIAIFGLARSGLSCATALLQGGAAVFAWDDSDPAQEKAKAEGLPVTNLHTVDFKTIDALVLSPGVPLTHPEPHWTVLKAKAAGVEIIGDTEIFAREAQAAGARIVAITGTNGKSTSTALTGHVLKHGNLDVHVGGNIGLAVFNLPQPQPNRIYVLELSSFQIDLMPSLHPSVGVLTNLSPDHLDRHGAMENYAAVKARMFAKMGQGDCAVVGVDDHWSKAIADGVSADAELRRVSVLHNLDDGVSAVDGILRDRRNGKIFGEIDLRGMSALRGAHNWQNAAVAYAVAQNLGLTVDNIAYAMRSFPGLAHRMQQIATSSRVLFVNDSKATNADAAEKALASFDDIYWIAGGISKTGGIESLKPYFHKIRHAFLIGVAADDFAKTLGNAVPHEVSGTIDVAVELAATKAAGSNARNPVVLFSPACSSFDQFKNFEVRGDAFVAAVSRLPDITMHAGEH
jgi:UDP-N-acetylmuramoylalanine--D-glutamate ligase